MEKAVELLLALYRNIRFSLNQRFELELALSRLAQLDDLVSSAELREAIAELRSGAGPGAARRRGRTRPPLFLHSEKPAAPAAAPVASPARGMAPAAARSASGRTAADAVNAPRPASVPADVDPRGLVARLVDGIRREKPAVVAAPREGRGRPRGRRSWCSPSRRRTGSTASGC